MLLGDHFAVVPIFVNAGAAILPALAAGIATFVALLFKPKALLQVCKQRPLVPLAILVAIGGIAAAIYFWPAPGGTAGKTRSQTRGATGAGAVPIYIDWTEVALARIEARKRGDIRSEAPQKAIAPPVTQLDAPLIFRSGPLRLGALGSAPEGELGMRWSYYPSWVDDDGTIETVESSMMLASPIVHGNRVYAASCELDPPDSYGIIFCIDADTGETIWSVDQIEGEELIGFFSSPALTADGKSLIIGQGLHPDTNCSLICLDAQTGEVQWTVLTELHIESSPAIEDGVVYVGAGAIEDPDTKKPTGHPGYVMAVRIEDGQELWRHDVADPESSPIVKDGIVYIGSGFNGKAVVALRTEVELNGQPRQIWSTPTPYPVTGAVTLYGDSILIGGGNGDFVFRDPNPAGVIMSLNRKDGTVQWTTDMPDAVLGAVAAGEYLVAPVASGLVVALDPVSGKPVWQTPISGQAPVLGGASVVGGLVYAVSHDGYLAKLSLTDGKILEKIYINDRTRPGEQGLSIGSPMIYHGRIFVGSETGGLRCYEGK